MGNRKTKNPLARYSALSSHRREGTKLVPDLTKLPFNMIDWEKDLLPEHLWMAALAEDFKIENAHKPFEAFLDALDTVWPDLEKPPLGVLSDFGLIPPEKRPLFCSEHQRLIRAVFLRPIGRILAFYPDSPASWLIDESFLEEGGSLDPAVELARLRRLIIKLLPGKDDVAGHIRVLPSTRLLKHGRLSFAGGKFDELIELMVRYPDGCDQEQKYRVQSFARTVANFSLTQDTEHQWPKYFWRHNYDLAVCNPVVHSMHRGEPVNEEQGRKLALPLERNASRAESYLALLARSVKCDLYSPQRDEILLGLCARLIRLCVLMASDPNLWARDTAGIVLRCLGDTAITFGYLAKCGTADDFERFKAYGEGQQKLLMLQLQDNYAGEKSLEGRSAGDLADELGYFMPELLQIELGSWSKKTARELAQDSGMERLYRLVFTPTSGDVHGTWFSLKGSNLCVCGEVLHRFHRLPAFAVPPMYVGTVVAAQEILEECIRIGASALSYPAAAEPFESISDLDRTEKN